MRHVLVGRGLDLKERQSVRQPRPAYRYGTCRLQYSNYERNTYGTAHLSVTVAARYPELLVLLIRKRLQYKYSIGHDVLWNRSGVILVISDCHDPTVPGRQGGCNT